MKHILIWMLLIPFIFYPSNGYAWEKGNIKITIDSVPSGATIYIDRKIAGKTPKIFWLKRGDGYTFWIDYSMYKRYRTTKIIEKDKEFNFCLIPKVASPDLKGEVVRIQNKDIYINIGRASDVSVGEIFKVIRKNKEIAEIKIVAFLGDNKAIAGKLEGEDIRVTDMVFFEKKERDSIYGSVLGIDEEGIHTDIGEDKVYIGKILTVKRYGDEIAKLEVVKIDKDISITKKISGGKIEVRDRVVATLTNKDMEKQRKRKIAQEKVDSAEKKKEKAERVKSEKAERKRRLAESVRIGKEREKLRKKERFEKKRERGLRAERRRERKLDLVGDIDYIFAYKNLEPTNEFFKSNVGDFDSVYLGLKLHLCGGTSLHPREPLFDLEIGGSYGSKSLNVEYVGSDGNKHLIDSIDNWTFDLMLNYNLLWLSPFPGVIPYVGVGGMFGQIWANTDESSSNRSSGEGESEGPFAKFGNNCYTTNFGVMLHWKSGFGVIIQYQKSFAAEYTDWKMISIGVSIWTD